MNFWKKKIFVFTMSFVMMFGVMCAVPALQAEAQAATIVEQRLQEYIDANPAGGAAYNCMAFAKQVFNYVFGYEAAGIDYHGNAKSECTMNVTNRLGSGDCAQMSGETSGDVSVESLKNLFANAKPGDIIQAMTGGHGKHTMVFVGADESGVTVYHGNWNGKIAYTTFPYEKFANKWSHTVTVYHATNYDQLNNPLNASPITASLALEGENVYPKTYAIDGVNYYSVRDMAYLLEETPYEFTVSNGDSGLSFTIGEKLNTDGTEMLEAGADKKTASLINTNVKVDGEEKAVSYYEIDGKAYFSVRQLAELIGFDVGWNNAEQTAEIKYVGDLIDRVMSFDNDVVDIDTCIMSDSAKGFLNAF